ncbi:Solute-binding protein [subsurface metagenome]
MRNKRLVTLLGGVCLVLVLAALPFMAACPAPVEDGDGDLTPTPIKPITLTVASWEGPGGCIMEAFNLWIKELEERSGGRVKCEVVYGGAMGPPPEHYDLAATGVADIAHVGLPYTPGRFPMAEVIELPIAKMSALDLTLGYWELYKRGYFDEDFKDVKVLYLIVVGPYSYQMGDKKVLSFDDMEGLKIRASGRMHTQIVEALGSVPVGMPAPDIYVSLEKGVIDGNLGSWDFMYAFRTELVTKYVTSLSIGGMGQAMVMNKDSYARLPADIRAIIDDMSDKYAIIGGQTITGFGELMEFEIFKEAGGEVIEFPDAELEKVWGAMAPIWDNWIAEGEEKGLSRQEMVDDLYHIFRHMHIEMPFHGYAP